MIACAPTITTAAPSLDGDAENRRDRAVVRNALRALTPVRVVVPGRHVHGPLALVAIAEAPAAAALTAAVVVGHDVVLAVARIPARADPGQSRDLGAGRAVRLRSAAAVAQESVDGAVAPVL